MYLPTEYLLKQYRYTKPECEGIGKYLNKPNLKESKRVVILISDKIDIKSKNLTRRQGHYIMMKVQFIRYIN